MLRVDRSPLSKRKWVRDSATDFCNDCCIRIKAGPFFTNKHHCRYCGNIVCSRCSQNKLNDFRICDSCVRSFALSVDDEWDSDSSEDELSPFSTPNGHYRKRSLSESSSLHTPYFEAFEVHITDSTHSPNIELAEQSVDGAMTECPDCPRTEYEASKQSASGWFERGDAAKRSLVYGFVRECWRAMLQFDGIGFPDEALMALLVESLTVSDGIDEYHTNLGIIHHREALCHLKNYRSVELIERTKEWNRECYHSFGSDIWCRGAQNVWKIKVSGHDDNAQRTCILIGIVEADKVQRITDRCERRHCGSFSDEEHGGYALLTGNWRTYHEDSDQGQLFSASADPIALTLSPNDVMAVEIDFTPKFGPDTSSKCGTLKYALNGSYAPFRNGGVAFDDIDIDKTYRFAVGMFLRDRLALYQVV